MSAYSDGRKPQIISLPGIGSGAGGTSFTEGFDQIPPLPQISNELESFFKAARHLELMLAQERTERKKLQERFRELEQKYEKASSDLEARVKEYAAKEEHVKAQLISCEEKQREY